MKLHMSPVSTTSRPLVLYIADHNLPVELITVDILSGEHHNEPFVSLNPNRLVPVLEDGDFVLTESGAILRYLAGKNNNANYPTDLKKRAKVDEMMDWFNTNLYRELGYHLVYPQLFPHHKREPEAVNAGTVEWGGTKALTTLKVLDSHYLGKGNKYLTGDELTIADYFGAGLLSCGDLIRLDLDKVPNVKRWYGLMRERPNWSKITEMHNGYAASLAEQKFVNI